MSRCIVPFFYCSSNTYVSVIVTEEQFEAFITPLQGLEDLCVGRAKHLGDDSMRILANSRSCSSLHSLDLSDASKV